MRKRRDPFGAAPRQRGRRFSPLALIGLLVSLVVLLGAGGMFLWAHIGAHAAAADAQPNTNCTLLVPANPLSAQGLATPYQLSATDPKAGPCNESNTDQSAFVQSVIYDRSAGTFSVYNPLIVDKGTKPAIAPTVPKLSAGDIVGIWFGFNADNLLLQGAQKTTLADSHCVNGLNQSLFTQFAYCNAVAFFGAVNQGIVAHRVTVPALGTAKDGKTCPTVRDFSVIDQDQSDNVQTQYLSLANGQTAQFSATNQAKLKNSTVLDNPSDNALLTNFIDPVLGCKEWKAPNLADNGAMVASLAMDEIQASFDQASPSALVPINDPMTTVGDNNDPSLAKTNLYRRGVDQITAANNQEASGAAYCKSYLQIGMTRLELDKPMTIKATTPDPGAANNLFTFLAQRFQGSWDELNCAKLINIPNPVTTQTDKNGVVTSATFDQSAPLSLLDCSANGKVVAGCNGTAKINGSTCTFAFDKNADEVQITCATK